MRGHFSHILPGHYRSGERSAQQDTALAAWSILWGFLLFGFGISVMLLGLGDTVVVPGLQIIGVAFMVAGAILQLESLESTRKEEQDTPASLEIGMP